MKIITFYTQAIGSNHIASRKPCQDNGTHYNDNGVSIVIVCDGHGGESYVRSDKGSELASQIAKEKILTFIERTPKELFAGKKGAVTVIPTVDPRINHRGEKKDLSMLSESEMDLLKQNISYLNAVRDIPEIEKSFRTLFNDIWNSWLKAIREDSETHEFSRSERDKLGSRRLEKAYGSTLMAAVRTKDYWFAFHIGDGKLFACNELMQWSEPVPWDCNCFLNVTTSLCDRDPVNEFRYAFDGTGYFPIAFALGSDGIDDTFIQNDLIHKFYSQLLCVFNERDQKEAEALLKESLSSWSEKGSHDDMSVAALIEKEKLPKAIEYYKIISEVRNLTAERNKKQENIIKIENKIIQLKTLIDKISSFRDEKAREFWNWWLKVCQKKKEELSEYQIHSKKVEELYHEYYSLLKELDRDRLAFEDWKKESSSRVSELKEKAQNITETIKIEEIKNEEKLITSDPKGAYNQTLECEIQSSTLDDNSDDQDTFIHKAESAKMTKEDVAKMEQESNTQLKEILNNHNK